MTNTNDCRSFFFFSSRRRHTRCYRDWSSDVCSSDLDRFAYSMSKGAVLTMTRSIAVDYMKRGIRCNCICPARIHTPFVDGYLAANYPGKEAEMMKELSEYRSE